MREVREFRSRLRRGFGGFLSLFPANGIVDFQMMRWDMYRKQQNTKHNWAEGVLGSKINFKMQGSIDIDG